MYNVEPYRTYRLYMPATKHYIEKLTIVNFIGKGKPWDLKGKEPVDESAYATFYCEQLEKWWKVSDSLTVEVAKLRVDSTNLWQCGNNMYQTE